MNYQNLLWQIETECEKWRLKKHKKKINFCEKKSDILNGFWIKENIGNNSFVFKKGDKLYVPPLKKSTDYQLRTTNNPVFRDKDENGKIIEEKGLKNFIFSQGKKTRIPYYIVDNHNWVFYCWAETIIKNSKLGIINNKKLPLLIHIDAHKDEAPVKLNPYFDLKDLKSVKRQTCALKVSNYISAAIQAKLIAPDFLSLTSTKDFTEYPKRFKLLKREKQNIILNVDIDIFAPEISFISLTEKIKAIGFFAKKADLITFATSPGFINQELAKAVVKILVKHL